MKQYNFFKIAVLSSILLIGTTGCEDFLTKDHPTATTDDEFWKTMNECENALGQCRSWPKAGHGGDDLSFVCMEGMTDNMYFLSNFEHLGSHQTPDLRNQGTLPPYYARYTLP